jgi:flagellar motor switch/type III secretory pathway protein FliN
MFKKAERKKAKLRMALCGPSGSGKTYSALQIAQGVGGKIAFIDTESGSGELYSHLCDYDICQISAPFTVAKYMAAIKGAEQAGYDILIIDSLTHAWAAEGGLLDVVDKKAATEKNSFAAWRHVTPLHNAFVDAILQSKCHIIATMRSKVAYEIQEDSRGKKVPVKVGLAPVQREGLDYEFTIVLDVSQEKHLAAASKDRTGIFDGDIFLPTPETGSKIKNWLESGAEAPPKENPLTERINKMIAAFGSVGVDIEFELAQTGKAVAALSEKDVIELGKKFKDIHDNKISIREAFPPAVAKTAQDESADALPWDEEPAAKPKPKDGAPAPPAAPDDGMMFSAKDDLLHEVHEEMRRLKITVLPPDMAKIFGTAEAGDIVDENDIKAVLAALKERK